MSDERHDAHDPQGAPTAGDGRDVMATLADLIMKRRSFGMRKYGVPLSPGNGRDALVDARDEALDLAAYLQQLVMQRDGGSPDAD